MDTSDSSDFHLPQSGSRLLSEDSFLPNVSSSSSASRTGPGGDDLSISELSLAEHPPAGRARRRPFSLLAQPASLDLGQEDSAIVDEEGGEEGIDETMTQEDAEAARKLEAKKREEKLQHDIFMLKKLNSAFEVYKEALRATKSGTEKVADQLAQTNALLDKYVNILAKSEKVTKLLLDERWEGAEADEEQLAREEQEAVERARREEEEQILAAQRERERLERLERERQAREEQEKLDREKAESAKTGRGSGVRGVRGTRASMRGARGTSRATAIGTTARASISSEVTAMRRPGSSTSARGTNATARGTSRRV